MMRWRATLVVGMGQLEIVAVWDGLIVIAPLDTSRPRYSMVSLWKSHLAGFKES